MKRFAKPTGCLDPCFKLAIDREQVSRYFLPPKDIAQEHQGGLHHRLNNDLVLRGHRRVGQFQRVEVENRIDDTAGGGRASADKNGQSIESGIHNENITVRDNKKDG